MMQLPVWSMLSSHRAWTTQMPCLGKCLTVILRSCRKFKIRQRALWPKFQGASTFVLFFMRCIGYQFPNESNSKYFFCASRLRQGWPLHTSYSPSQVRSGESKEPFRARTQAGSHTSRGSPPRAQLLSTTNPITGLLDVRAWSR